MPLTAPYQLLPFRFARESGRVLLVNEVGQHAFLPEDSFDRFASNALAPESPDYTVLKSRFFLADSHIPQVVDQLANAYRTKKRFLWDFTTLHMLVLTRRCNQRCTYCHASSTAEDAGSKLDMDVDTLHRCIDAILCAPAQALKIEFQGGEPLLRFDLVMEAVSYAREANSRLENPKRLDFVICTNLVALTHSMLDFISSEGIH